jgi:hypothetical protein
MDLQEPKWRAGILRTLHAITHGVTTHREVEAMKQAVEAAIVDDFDLLVQAIADGNLLEAVGVLRTKYPGSIERAVAIKNALRGTDVL